MNDSGRYRDLNKAHEDALKAAQEARDKAEALRQDKLREDGAATMEVARAREVSQRLGYAAVKEYEEAARKSVVKAPFAALAPAPPRSQPKKVELQPSSVDQVPLATAQNIPSKQPTQFFTLEGTVAARMATSVMPLRPVDKREQDYARHQREDVHRAKAQAERSERQLLRDPKEHAAEELDRQRRLERDQIDRERRVVRAREQAAKAPAIVPALPSRREPVQLRADSRPATARGPDTGRLSEAAPARPVEAVRERTDKEVRRETKENQRPKTDRDVFAEAARAMCVRTRSKGRGDDDGGGGGGGRDR